MKHSIGPWTIDFTSDKRSWGYVRSPLNDPKGHKRSVCRVSYASHTFAESMGNLHLIGAAPDLLQACEAALQRVTDPRVAQQIEDAVRKAKGQR